MKRTILIVSLLSLTACTVEHTPPPRHDDTLHTVTPDSLRRGADTLGRPAPPVTPQ